MAIFHDYVDDIPAAYLQPDTPIMAQQGSIFPEFVQAGSFTAVDDVFVGRSLATNGLQFSVQVGAGPSTQTLPATGVVFLRCDTTPGLMTINLPPATFSGVTFIFKRISGGGNNADITPDGADTIDGVAAAYSLVAQYDSVTLVDTNIGEWSIIAVVP